MHGLAAFKSSSSVQRNVPVQVVSKTNQSNAARKEAGLSPVSQGD